MESIWTKTTYDNYEIIVVENNSTESETFQYYKEIEPQHDNLKVIVDNRAVKSIYYKKDKRRTTEKEIELA